MGWEGLKESVFVRNGILATTPTQKKKRMKNEKRKEKKKEPGMIEVQLPQGPSGEKFEAREV